MDGRSIDCTRWNGDQVSLLHNAPDVGNIFPNVNQEIGAGSTEQTCQEVVKDILELAFTSKDDPDADSRSDRCYTDCTATLSSTSAKCKLSVLLLENVDVHKLSDLSPSSVNMPLECGIYNITCCMESIPAECLSEAGESDESTGGDLLAPIVGGVVGSVVGLAGLIVMALVVGIVVMVCSRQKKKKQQQRYADNNPNMSRYVVIILGCAQ